MVYFDATFREVPCRIEVPENIIKKGEEAIRSYIAKKEKMIEYNEWDFIFKRSVQIDTINRIEE